MGFQHFMDNGFTEEDSSSPRHGFYVLGSTTLRINDQYSAMSRLPMLIEVTHHRDHPVVSAAKSIDVLAVIGSGRIIGQVEFKILESQVTIAVQPLDQLPDPAKKELQGMIGQGWIQPADGIVANGIVTLVLS